MRIRRSFVLTAVVVALLAIGAFAIPSARRRAESMQCGNHIVSIGFAARLWANDHDGRLPSDLLSMSNEVVKPRIFICPGDHSRKPAENWITFTPAQSSYEVVTPGLREGDSNGVFLRCKIHGHVGYADTTVFDGVRRRTKTLW